MPDDLASPESQLRAIVRADERMLWAGQPDHTKLLTRADAVLIPISIVWCGFMVFWEAAAATSKAPAFFVLWGALFLAFGSYLLCGRFWVKRRRNRVTAYALADRRALISTPNSLRETPVAGQPITVNHARGGRHASVFIGPLLHGFGGLTSSVYGNTGLDFWSRGSSAFAFYDVAEPAAMLAALEQAQNPT